jgi:2-haloacid dehalogenase
MKLFREQLQNLNFCSGLKELLFLGQEKTRKPFPEIYQLTLSRFNLKAEESLFIDDNLRNIEAARELGIHSIHFENPDQLEEVIKNYINN